MQILVWKTSLSWDIFSFVTEEIKYLLDKLSSSDDDDDNELLYPLQNKNPVKIESCIFMLIAFIQDVREH